MVPAKYLKKVLLSSDVYAACLQHALVTEKEEVMGLLIGDIDEDQCISEISACVILLRVDKQPHRVEISPEHLCNASSYAEELAEKLKKPMRVVGWYHSHPHITVWPSRVDVTTQGMYQRMDPLFVGLIFSVYQSEGGSKANRVELTCFQSFDINSEPERREIAVEIVDSPLRQYNLESILSLPKILTQEEIQNHEKESVDEKYNDDLAKLHNDSLKTVALGEIVSKSAKPLYEDLDYRLKCVNLQIKELEAIKSKLLG